MCNHGYFYNLQVDPLYASAIVLTGRVWDAITDPIIGNLSLRSKTRLGRLRPWYVTMCVIVCHYVCDSVLLCVVVCHHICDSVVTVYSCVYL